MTPGSWENWAARFEGRVPGSQEVADNAIEWAEKQVAARSVT
jgi:hypothetical protein